MKKSRAAVVVIAAFVSMLSLAGCGDKVISGSPKTIVQAAEELSTKDEMTVEVTGTTKFLLITNGQDEYQEGDGIADISADEGDYTVTLVFTHKGGMTAEEAEKINAGRVTARGTIKGTDVFEDNAFLYVDEIE